MRKVILAAVLAAVVGVFFANSVSASVRGLIVGGKHDGQCVDDDSFKTGHSNHADETFLEGGC